MAEALEVTPAELDAFADRLGEVESYLHLDEKRTRVTELEAKSVAPGFWDDADAARATMEEIARAKEDIAAVDNARGELSDARAALELAEEMGDDPDAAALRKEAAATAERLARAIDELELSSWFTGEFDHGDAIVTIKPGQGGLEAQDWTFMLFKMYMKYCQRRGCTKLRATGMYSGAEKPVIMVIVSRRELNTLKTIVRERDPRAIVTVADVTETFGEGFKDINA